MVIGNCVILFSAVLSQYTRLTTNRQTTSNMSVVLSQYTHDLV